MRVYSRTYVMSVIQSMMCKQPYRSAVGSHCISAQSLFLTCVSYMAIFLNLLLQAIAHYSLVQENG